MQDINDTLKNVRKAYRLIYNYQRSVLDLISFLSNKLGFDYQGGYTKFSEQSPRNGGGRLKAWSWDWMNLYYYEFHFNKKIVENDELHFSILHMADSGYFDIKQNNSISQVNIESFNDVNLSTTNLIFVVGKNTWGILGDDNWKNNYFVNSPSGKKEDEKGIMVFKKYSLESFSDEASATSVLLDFQKFCLGHNIDIIIKERDFE